MRFEILGSLRVIDGDLRTTISAQKTGTVLATLLARADSVVPTEELLSELWGGNPPRRANATLHVYISQLRKIIRSPGSEDRGIVTRAPGYMLQLGDDELDFEQFQRLMDQGREQARTCRHEEAVASLGAALALWRGPALSQLRGGPVLGNFATYLDELHLECTELLLTSNIILGRHQQLVPQLRTLITRHPLHEVFYQQLMTVLYRCGRRAEALDVYQHARHTLNSELGLEPCRALRELQQSILLADTEADAEASMALPLSV